MMLMRLLPPLMAAVFFLAACGERQDRREPPPTRVTADEAAEAAAILGLEEPGRASWETREYVNGVFRFEGFSLVLSETGAEEEDEEPARSVLRAELMEIAAPRLEAGVVRFDRLILDNGVVSDDEGGETRFERLVIDRPGPELSRSVAASFTQDGKTLPGLGGNLAAYSFRELAISGLSVTLPDAEGNLQAGALTLRGLDAAGLELASVEAISFDGPATRFQIESLRMEEIGSRFLASLFDGTAATPLQTAVSGNPADYYRTMEMAGLSGAASGVIFEIESLSGEVTREGTRLRTTGSLPALRLRAERGTDPGEHVHNVLGFLGYQEVVMRLETDTIYDPETDMLSTQNQNRFVWEDGLTLSVHHVMTGIQAYSDAVAAARESGITDPDAMAAYESLLRLNTLEIRLEDHSLLDRSFSAYAQMSGVTPAQMRVQASALVALGLSALPAEIPRPFINAIAQPLSEFIRDGGTLVIRLDPPQPVALPGLTGPDGQFDIDRLGLSVSVERAG